MTLQGSRGVEVVRGAHAVQCRQVHLKALNSGSAAAETGEGLRGDSKCLAQDARLSIPHRRLEKGLLTCPEGYRIIRSSKVVPGDALKAANE